MLEQKEIKIQVMNKLAFCYKKPVESQYSSSSRKKTVESQNTSWSRKKTHTFTIIAVDLKFSTKRQKRNLPTLIRRKTTSFAN